MLVVTPPTAVRPRNAFMPSDGTRENTGFHKSQAWRPVAKRWPQAMSARTSMIAATG
jgi:hypothetical protein